MNIVCCLKKKTFNLITYFYIHVLYFCFCWHNNAMIFFNSCAHVRCIWCCIHSLFLLKLMQMKRKTLTVNPVIVCFFVFFKYCVLGSYLVLGSTLVTLLFYTFCLVLLSVRPFHLKILSALSWQNTVLAGTHLFQTKSSQNLLNRMLH